MIDKNLFIHPLELEAFEELRDSTYFDEEVMDYYKNFDEKLKKPDLLGKTVMVAEKQFASVYNLAKKVAGILDMEIPSMYVYEDFYYGVEAKGTENPWIEISAKTLTDFDEDELLFLISREMCSIKLKHYYYDILIDESLSAFEQYQIVPGTEIVLKSLKVSMYKWSRISQYSEDCFGYIMCGSIAPCVNAILKLILNNSYLAGNVDLPSYLKQADQINRLDEVVYNATKLDEKVPYGPFRIKHLISYASSERGIVALQSILRGTGIC